MAEQSEKLYDGAVSYGNSYRKSKISLKYELVKSHEEVLRSINEDIPYLHKISIRLSWFILESNCLGAFNELDKEINSEQFQEEGKISELFVTSVFIRKHGVITNKLLLYSSDFSTHLKMSSFWMLVSEDKKSYRLQNISLSAYSL